MATKIFNTTTKQTVELELICDGQDFLADVINGCDQDGRYASEDMPDDAHFAMDDEDLDWWTRWTEREQRILDKTEELGDEAQQAIAGLAAEYGSDLELLQDKEEEYLGIAK